MATIGTIRVDDQDLDLIRGAYPYGGATSIRLIGNDEDGCPSPWGCLTVNIPGTDLASNEVLVKTWSENEQFRGPALASGLFADTGRRIRTGFVAAEVWRLLV